MALTKSRGGVRAGRLAALAALAAFLVWAARREPVPAATGRWIAQAGLTPAFETIDGTRVRYLRTGQGPTLVLLHGFASSLYTWKDVLPALSAHHDVVALDFPGFGESDRPSSLAWDGYAPMVLGLMDRLGIARASLAGNSMGGAVAVLAAAAAPERIDKLALIDSAGFNLAPEDRPAVLRLLQTPLAPVIGRLPVRRPLTRLALRQIFADDRLVTEERVDEYLAPLMRPGTFEGLRSLLDSAGADMVGRFEAAARSVRSPALVIWGAEDAWVPSSDADRFVAAIPGARKVVIPGCGHMPQEETPAATAALIEDFLTPSSG